MGFICKTDYEKMHGQTINIGELKINYKESVTSAPIAVVKLGELGGRYYWWYSSKKFVFAGNAFVAGYKIMQIGEGEMYNRMEIILTASICYEHGEFFYSERRNKRNGCLIFDPGVAAIDYLKVKFFLYSFSFIALFPFCRMGGMSIVGMARRLKPRIAKLRKGLSLILILVVSAPVSAAIICIMKGAKIFTALAYHWIFICPDGHGIPGFEAYNMLLVPLGLAVLFTVFEPNWFYSKLLDVFMPAVIFGLVSMFFGAGLIMILCNPPVMTIVILGVIIALGLSFYFWLMEGM